MFPMITNWNAVNEPSKKELRGAKIPASLKLPKFLETRLVRVKPIGQLRNWLFIRGPAVWVAHAHFPADGLPENAMRDFNVKHSTACRIIGLFSDHGHPSVVNAVELRTQRALTAFAHLIKAFAKE
jgi:hypothetical protein